MITPIIKKRIFASAVLVMLLTSQAQPQTALEKYVELGTKNNLVLQQKNLSLERAMFALKEANRMFYPSVSLLGDYLSGDGGRNISVPVGDLLNPVYATLNQLTASQNFPQIENSTTNFLPENYYDARIRTVLPIINSDLIYNKKIRNDQVLLSEYEVKAYEKELTKTISLAYYQYLNSLKAVEIYESAEQLAAEGKRINESLLANGKSTRAYVLRSESELQTLESKRKEAVNQAENAKMYFNFLINEDPSSAIDTTYSEAPDLAAIETMLLKPADITNREELRILERATSIREHLERKEKSYWYPKLNGFLDLGSQASDFEYNNESRYYLVGVQLEVPLFTAGRNRMRVNQSKLDYRQGLLENDNTSNQLRLSANIARNDLGTAYENYKASLKQLESATAYHRLVERGYREGVNSFIETIDARNQVTSSSMQVIISRYTLLGKLATYKREQSL